MQRDPGGSHVPLCLAQNGSPGNICLENTPQQALRMHLLWACLRANIVPPQGAPQGEGWVWPRSRWRALHWVPRGMPVGSRSTQFCTQSTENEVT